MPSRKRKRAGSPEATPDPNPSVIDNKRCALLDVPLEVRQRIFEACFQHRGLRSTCERTCADVCQYGKYDYTPLLLVCRQFHAEVWPIYTSHVKFTFEHPIQLANNFLSFLPHQRLCKVKHLALNDHVRLFHSRKDKSFVDDLERSWWHYLDVFSRLDTFAIDMVTQWGDSYYNAPFYSLVAVLVGMLEQGCPKKPKWVSKKRFRSLRIASDNLPPSHDWELEFGSRVKSDLDNIGPRVRNQLICQRVVVRQGRTKSHAVEHLFHGWGDRPSNHFTTEETGVATTETSSPLFSLSLSHSNRQRNELVVSRPNYPDIELLRCKLGAETRSLYHEQGVPNSLNGLLVESVALVGRWKNTRFDA